MNTHADKTPENKSQSVAHEVSQKRSSSESTFKFVDNRPEAIAQRKLQEMANNSPQVAQLRAFQNIANIYSDCKQQTIQKKGFADPANPNNTRQWEGKGYFSREQGDERPAALAALVDQYKKEILTYIAHYINTQRVGNYGPHIAVVITGSNWNISVNSNIPAVNQGHLQADANAAKTHIDNCWNSLDNTYGGFFTTKTWFENDTVEAAYLAFRWAASKTNVRAINNAGPAANRRVHGEMRIIDNIQGEAPDIYTPLLPGAVHPVVPAPGVALPANYRRVVRVGGTKTPCFDCAWEMHKVPTHNQAQANVNTQAPGAHHAAHGAHMVGAGANERVATTMSPTFGPSFPTWQNTDATRGRRTAPIALGGTANFQANQAQNYNALRAAYIVSGCAPAMI